MVQVHCAQLRALCRSLVAMLQAKNMDWTNCQQHACSEIRAASLSGQARPLLGGGLGWGLGRSR